MIEQRLDGLGHEPEYRSRIEPDDTAVGECSAVSAREVLTMGRPAFARSTATATTRHMSSILTATTSRRSSTPSLTLGTDPLSPSFDRRRRLLGVTPERRPKRAVFHQA